MMTVLINDRAGRPLEGGEHTTVIYRRAAAVSVDFHLHQVVVEWSPRYCWSILYFVPTQHALVLEIIESQIPRASICV